jgi:hypothetical protein
LFVGHPFSGLFAECLPVQSSILQSVIQVWF